MTTATQIPRHIHQIWLGDPRKMPSGLKATWKMPGWKYTLWTEKEIDALKLVSRSAYDFYFRRKLWPGASNVARVEILRRVGGIYVDSDAERLIPWDHAPFLSADFFAAEANNAVGVPRGVARIANSIIGSIADHPILIAYTEAMRDMKDLIPSWSTTGGTLLTRMVGLHRTSRTAILPPHTFYPQDKSGRASRTRSGDGGLGTYARHLWGSTHGRYSASWHTKESAAVPEAPKVQAPAKKAAPAKHRILIMAQGEARRFPGKHFAVINDEPLLHRTLRLVRELTKSEIIVVGWNTEPFLQLKAELHVQPDPGKGLLDGVWNTRALWTDCTTYLLGDVVFSRAALQKCLAPSEFTFFGRRGANPFTKCPYGEIFGMCVDSKGQEIVSSSISDPGVRKHREGRLWGLWERVKGRANWSAIDDWTDDVDKPAELEALRKMSATIAKES